MSGVLSPTDYYGATAGHAPAPGSAGAVAGAAPYPHQYATPPYSTYGYGTSAATAGSLLSK